MGARKKFSLEAKATPPFLISPFPFLFSPSSTLHVVLPSLLSGLLNPVFREGCIAIYRKSAGAPFSSLPLPHPSFFPLPSLPTPFPFPSPFPFLSSFLPLPSPFPFSQFELGALEERRVSKES